MHIKTPFYSKTQLFTLVSLRVLIGWYFLYEGLIKLFTPNWTAFPYLMDSKGIFSGVFINMAENPHLLSAINFINIYGLILVGLSLILGCLTRLGYIGAIFFLILFYLSHPPLMHAKYLMPPEGSYLWVDKNLIILFAILALMVFPTSKIIGLDRMIYRKRMHKRNNINE